MEENNSNLVKCPDCGNMYSRRIPACPKCGGPNDEYRQPANQQQQEQKQSFSQAAAPSAAAGKKCPECGASVNKFATACPQCGAKLMQEAAVKSEVPDQKPIILNHQDLYVLAKARKKMMLFLCLFVILALVCGIIYGAESPSHRVTLAATFMLILSACSLFATFHVIKVAICLKKTWCYIVGILTCNPFFTLFSMIVIDQYSWWTLKKYARQEGIRPGDYSRKEYCPSSNPATNLCLFSPESAIAWSSFLTPVFGTFLLWRNYLSLEESSKAQKSVFWLIGLAVYYVILTIICIYVPDNPWFGTFLLFHLLVSIFWYVWEALPQMRFLNQFNIDYNTRSMKQPLLIAWIPAILFVYGPYFIILIYVTFILQTAAAM